LHEYLEARDEKREKTFRVERVFRSEKRETRYERKHLELREYLEARYERTFRGENRETRENHLDG
jgi:hypothetical protein